MTWFLIFLLTTTIGTLAQSNAQAPADYEYYEYYYADEVPLTSAAGSKATAAAEEKVPDYDITELVKAWKEYIKEKAEAEQTSSDDYYYDAPTPPRRRRPRPRPSQVRDEYEDDYDQRPPTRRRRPKPAVREDERRSPPKRRRPKPTIRDYDDYYYDAPTPPRRQRPKPVEYEEYECEPREESYRTPDVAQCDKYYECNIKGELKELLCDDGLVFDEKSQSCDYPSKVECGSRKELQTAQPSKNCPRANGFFAWPAEESCQKFWDCRGGNSYLQVCPEGVIFDMKVDACVTPDQSQRDECRAEKFLKYDCPNYSAEEPLRFGNHDRLPDPDNCQKFYSCLRDGQPRLGVCPRKTVFNNATGLCDDPKAVSGCESFWKDKEQEELLDYYDYS